jgi:hypothetical protein
METRTIHAMIVKLIAQSCGSVGYAGLRLMRAQENCETAEGVRRLAIFDLMLLYHTKGYIV